MILHIHISVHVHIDIVVVIVIVIVVVIVDDDVEIDREDGVDKGDEKGKESKDTSLLPEMVVHTSRINLLNAACQLNLLVLVHLSVQGCGKHHLLF